MGLWRNGIRGGFKFRFFGLQVRVLSGPLKDEWSYFFSR